MKVVFLKDIEANGQVRESVERKPTFKQQRQPDGTTIEVPERVGKPATRWEAGATIEMSETSAQKYIDAGLAKPASGEKKRGKSRSKGNRSATRRTNRSRKT